MSIDPMALVNEARPTSAVDLGQRVPGALRRARETQTQDHSGNVRNVDELETRPGTAAYNSKIPPPPCALCAQDHQPGRTYDHEYRHPGDLVLTPGGQYMPVPSETAVAPSVATPGVTAGTQRVNIIPGRGEDVFILSIEEAPDWDLRDSWKLTASEILPMLPILRGLGVKVRDNTAGELVALELERRGH